MLSRPSSSAAVLVSPRTAHLLATYAASPNVAVNPAPDEILTIAPPPAFRIEGSTARISPNLRPTYGHGAADSCAVGSCVVCSSQDRVACSRHLSHTPRRREGIKVGYQAMDYWYSYS